MCFLDEGIQYDDFLTFDGTKERTPNTFLAFSPDFEKPFAHRGGIGLADSWAEFLNNFSYMEKIGQYSLGKAESFILYFAIEKRDFPRH